MHTIQFFLYFTRILQQLPKRSALITYDKGTYPKLLYKIHAYPRLRLPIATYVVWEASVIVHYLLYKLYILHYNRYSYINCTFYTTIDIPI